MSESSNERERLIEMVRRIQNASACVVDFDSMLNQLEEKLQDKQISQLIFDPPGGTPMSAEEIVDQALAKRKS